MDHDVTELLVQLVSTPSVNPMGRDVEGDIYYEKRLTDLLEELFKKWHLPYQRQTVARDRDNIVAYLEGRPRGTEVPTIVFEAHQDTVPVDGMTIEPFGAVIRDGRLYGRGACDIKGGMAAILATLQRLLERPPKQHANVVAAFSVNEEHGFTGARALADWLAAPNPLVSNLPAAVIVAEPTELDVVVGHKGVLRWRCTAGGRAAHSSMPAEGDNAIYRMASVVTALSEYAQQLQCQEPCHPLLGQPSLSVGRIWGGVSVNTVPDQCTVEIDHRLLPGTDPAEARQAVIDQLAERGLRENVYHEQPFLVAGALDERQNQTLARWVRAVARQCGGSGRLCGVPYGTDAPAFQAIGLPTVVFGPGSIAQAHTCDEWISLEQLSRGADAFYQLACQAAEGLGWPTHKA